MGMVGRVIGEKGYCLWSWGVIMSIAVVTRVCTGAAAVAEVVRR